MAIDKVLFIGGPLDGRVQPADYCTVIYAQALPPSEGIVEYRVNTWELDGMFFRVATHGVVSTEDVFSKVIEAIESEGFMPVAAPKRGGHDGYVD